MTGFDVIVVGGGHAGVEAAYAAARKGALVGVVTFDPAMIGAMSCNPAIGGIGKGHIVREVDVFGGLIAQCADQAAIHYRMLNRSRGRAVWGPRVQADRRLFATAVQGHIRSTSGLTVIAGEAARLLSIGGIVSGVELPDGRSLASRAVVLATGTFLGATLFFGRERKAGGRIAEPAAEGLAHQVRELGTVARLKTGTPPRLDGRTIDWARLAEQPSDDERWTMAPYRSGARNPQLSCAITHTGPETHALILEAAGESALLSGDFAGVGPRYCPSIEDKVTRFADRERHQLFLEPEGLDTPLVYPNGLSTSLSPDAQTRIVRSIAGLERVEIVQPGYAVEYDYIDPRGLDHRLASRSLPGLFAAGQINGTTGYEEAAGQGLVAGLNAAAHALGFEPVLFDRRESYVGVMIDDLTLQGVTEPYRMLTARSERRLHLRSDNAEARLGDLALESGVLDAREVAVLRDRQDRRARLLAGREGAGDPLEAEIAETLHYRPYVERERLQTERLETGVNIRIPSSLDYRDIDGLSTEMSERLQAAAPATLADAQRIRGVTPAAVTALMLACRRVSA